ncbi:hypothetical protein [Mycobacterium tuberculosis]|uniref:hypothetical protein n=1 Tax=Mycobacterium tuberculosis TaxID=1773 RepID=UPI00272D1F24|nr:hypothetical protein [Mycobacterium tuberculosis]
MDGIEKISAEAVRSGEVRLMVDKQIVDDGATDGENKSLNFKVSQERPISVFLHQMRTAHGGPQWGGSPDGRQADRRRWCHGWRKQIAQFQGEQYLEPLGIKVAFAPPGILVALVFIGLPFVVRTVQPVLEDMESELEEAASKYLEPLGIKVAFAPPGILVALVFIGLPFVVRTVQAGVRLVCQMDRIPTPDRSGFLRS